MQEKFKTFSPVISHPKEKESGVQWLTDYVMVKTESTDQLLIISQQKTVSNALLHYISENGRLKTEMHHLKNSTLPLTNSYSMSNLKFPQPWYWEFRSSELLSGEVALLTASVLKEHTAQHSWDGGSKKLKAVCSCEVSRMNTSATQHNKPKDPKHCPLSLATFLHNLIFCLPRASVCITTATCSTSTSTLIPSLVQQPFPQIF